jgi:hypothetical protein
MAFELLFLVISHSFAEATEHIGSKFQGSALGMERFV